MRKLTRVAGPLSPIYSAVEEANNYSPAHTAAPNGLGCFQLGLETKRGKHTFLNSDHVPHAVFDAYSCNRANYSIFTTSNISKPAMKQTHMYLLQMTPFALLIPILLNTPHQCKPLNICSRCWVHFPIWIDAWICQQDYGE